MASPPLLRADIFYDSVFDHAQTTGSDVARLLGAVMAHEVVHVLLPALTHTPSGLMKAQWDGHIVRVPGFTVDQGTAIRAAVTAAVHVGLPTWRPRHGSTYSRSRASPTRNRAGLNRPSFTDRALRRPPPCQLSDPFPASVSEEGDTMVGTTSARATSRFVL